MILEYPRAKFCFGILMHSGTDFSVLRFGPQPPEGAFVERQSQEPRKSPFRDLGHFVICLKASSFAYASAGSSAPSVTILLVLSKLISATTAAMHAIATPMYMNAWE